MSVGFPLSLSTPSDVVLFDIPVLCDGDVDAHIQPVMQAALAMARDARRVPVNLSRWV